MRTLIEVAWTCYSSRPLLDALEGAELVGIVPTHIVFRSNHYFERAQNLLLQTLELRDDSFFRIVDKCDAYIAIQHNSDESINAHIDYARKHGIPTAVWQL